MERRNIQFSPPDISEAAVKTAVMKQSEECFVLADSSKFGKVLPVTFADLDEACILTDRLPNPIYRQHTVIKEVKQDDIHADL